MYPSTQSIGTAVEAHRYPSGGRYSLRKIVYDGDLVLVMDEPMMLDGIDKDCAIVLNIDEKMTAKAELVTKENIAELVSRTLVSLIGECSNAATCYHNKPWKTEETKQRYNRNIDILSIVNSFAIDSSQSLVIWKHIIVTR